MHGRICHPAFSHLSCSDAKRLSRGRSAVQRPFRARPLRRLSRRLWRLYGVGAFSLPTLKPTLGGVNWAVVYGLALIVGAFLLAVLYMLLCRDGGKDAA